MKSRINSKGFAAVESLLIVIIVLLVGFIGYYVWHTQKQSDKSLDQALKASQSATVKSKSSAKSAAKNYLTITEWSVRAPYDGKLTLEYKLGDDSAGEGYALFSSKELDAEGETCKQGNYGGAVHRYKSSEHYLAGDSQEDTGKTAAQIATEMGGGKYGHVGDYYYFYTSPQAYCSDTSSDTQKQTMDAIKALLPKLEAAS